MSEKENCKIILKFDKTLEYISGNKFGREIFEKQLKNIMEKNDEYNKYIVVFPREIKGVSISFTQGMISEIVNKIGREETFKHLKFMSEYSDTLTRKINNDMYY